MKRRTRKPKAAHHDRTNTVKLPPLTGWMRAYVAFMPVMGYAPDNWVSKFDASLTSVLFNREPQKQRERLQDPTLPQATATPFFFYHKAPLAYTPKFQLLLRLGQFYTASLRHKMFPATTPSPSCPQCHCPKENTHHIFVDCPHYEPLRQEALNKSRTFFNPGRNKESSGQESDRVACERWEEYAKETIRGKDGHESRFYYGIVPPAVQPLTAYSERLAHNLAITLTSRIAGAYLRDTTSSSPNLPREPRPPDRTHITGETPDVTEINRGRENEKVE